MSRKLENLRNIGIIAHIDAGKTTVTERMLYYAKASHKMGDVDKGTTITDFDPEEQERGITIYSASVTFQWKDVTINLIDTPGHVDFTAEVERSLRVLDGGVVVFSAREGVEAQSETVWRQADKYAVPRLAFINKLDREGADFHGTLDEIRERLNSNPVAIQIPWGLGPPHVANPFRGVVDLVGMRLLTFTPESQGAEVVESELPAELRDEAELWREQMLEQLFDYSNELAELVLEKSAVPTELIRKVLRGATLHRLIVPVLCGSALDYSGIQPLLDAVMFYLPSPADVPPIEGIDPKKPDRRISRKPDPEEPFSALVFKILADKHGDLYFLRIYSGRLKANSRVYNPGKDKKENAAQLWHIQADRREQVPSAEAGDIVGVIGPRISITGDTLCDSAEPILLESIQFPETVISMAIEPETSLERKKLGDILEMMKRQDPTFRAHENEETGQTIISGMGELHLEVIKHRLLRDFNLDVRVHKPRVSYKETVSSSAEATGKCQRQVGGQVLFAEAKIRVRPRGNNKPCEVFTNWFTESAAVRNAVTILVSALKEHAEGGGLLGCPLWSCAIEVLEHPFPEPMPSEVALRIAAADAFTKVLEAAGIVLLEPIMALEVTTPEDHLGDIINDLQQRRAIITSTQNRGINTVIEAEVPLATMFGYSAAVRSLSQGRATFSMEPLKYGPAPTDVQAAFI
ncbi:MAG TPA: elongation factor G [Pirellulales bacterium]|jgi:elongation factor G|nr:elongation factor G [Pirellulales bacterium]